jgi:hypothetical protein
MEITFYKYTDEPNKLTKTLSDALTLTGDLRSECKIETPEILIESSISINDFNYFYIPDFNRYYFRTGITAVRTNLFRVSGRTDVLMSFNNDIKQFQVLLNHSEVAGTKDYAQSGVWNALVKTKTDIITFPNGLSENGEFILITAGG